MEVDAVSKKVIYFYKFRLAFVTLD